ncbi:DNA recombination protein RmuC [Alphaproteobacteria bacterium LSUCC0684]
MDNLILILLALMLIMAIVIAVMVLRRQRNEPSGMEVGEIKGQLEQLSQMTSLLQAQVTTQLQNQERSLNETLRKQAETTGQKLGDLQSRLAVIDKAHASLTELSAQTTRLENVLSNKQARGAYGEMQLENLVRQVLPPNAYKFQAKLANGSRPDCLLLLPNPPGPIVIDAKFPLEAWYELGEAEDDIAKLAARKKLAAALATHVEAIAGKYIITGETAESAMLFLPSEAVYAEFHTHHPKVLEDSFKKRVYLTSPTTLMATLNTVRAILRDVKMREQATVIQAEVARLLEDITRLDKRVGNLSQHFALAQKDISEITTSTRKITQRSEAIERIEVEENSPSSPTPEDPPRLID